MDNIENKTDITEDIAEEITADITEDTAEESIPAENTRTPHTEAEWQELWSEYESLSCSYAEAKIQRELLMCGVHRERLLEAQHIAAYYLEDGFSYEDAAEKTVREHPDMRLMPRELPKFGEQTRGRYDGMAAIRNLFSRR